MIYLARKGRLAGPRYGCRRRSLGERWTAEFHYYIGPAGETVSEPRPRKPTPKRDEMDETLVLLTPVPTRA